MRIEEWVAQVSRIPKVILLIEKSRAFGRGLLRGIVHYSNLHGPWLFCMEPQVYQKGSSRSLRWMQSLGADAVMAHTWDNKLIEMILDLRLPAMICGIPEPVGMACRIVTDEVAVGQMAAEYLVGRGFRRFAYCGFDDVVWSRRRQENFCRTVTAAGYPVYVYQQPRRKTLSLGQEQPIIADWLRGLPRPIAVMAGNDDRAQDVLAACKIAGLAVPNEVAILGVDNDELVCGLSYPQLSSIALGTERAGFEAARVLDRLIHGQTIDPQDRQVPVIPMHVVTRQSTDILAVEDKAIAEAVRFIHSHVRQPIQVSDVAEAVGLSKRALQQRFRQVLSRSVHQEIQASRVNHMAQLLINTNLSIFQIAGLLGYPDASNLSRYFRRQMGMNPSVYRKRMGTPSVLTSRGI